MGTATKPKSQPDIYRIPVRFNKQEQQEIVNHLGYWEQPVDAQKTIIRKLNRELTFYFNWLRRLRNQPTSASVRVELEAIDKLTTELADKLHQNTISMRAAALLGCQNGELWSGLTYLAMNAQLGIEQLKKAGKSHGGAQNRHEKDVHDSVKAALTNFFDKNALYDKTSQKEIKEARHDFLDICLGKMPSRPNKKKSYKA